ncbi:phosphatase PAP2 family protein [secondary endosymbiont of Ctenarytaina eucalypti]|uniref:PAP2 superfamily protein n=1 Tax=secondary endosymbiont of Ctenarytaina eucalypti TaxID=1199245 RepID=J3VR56_9ENTR|nr:phosphatase PAP2 family protein [secondary endosymbiont of Ctenarytaina eucalypti]AFP84416.1 PAP2 superfamily protein [secondary endosymbiont of Ctenarytaina eucalypti]
MSWHWVTFFGDSMLLLPCAGVIMVMLLLKADTRQSCWQWLMLFSLTGATVVVSKLAFMGWGIGSSTYDFTGFSGHSALSASIWPIILWILFRRARPIPRISMVVIGYLLAMIIGLSRVIIQAHSASEILSGLALGYVMSTRFLLMQHAQNASLCSLTNSQIAVILILSLLLVVQGKKAPTQNLLEKIALNVAPVKKVYTRNDLHFRAIRLERGIIPDVRSGA